MIMTPWILQLVIYSALIIQLLYFLISNVCYIYHNPQYRMFWALFYLNSPTNANIKSTVPLPTIARDPTQLTNTETTESADTSFRNLPAPPSTQRTSGGTSSQQTSTSAQPTDVPFQIDPTQIVSKHTAFVHFGLETLSHCILTQLFLICMLFALCIRLAVSTIEYNATWNRHRSFCSAKVKLISMGITTAHYLVQIILCISPFKVQYMYNTPKRHRVLPLVAIIFLSLSIPIQMSNNWRIKMNVTQYKGETLCIGPEVPDAWTSFIIFDHYFSWIVCFITVIVPIYVQRRVLLNLPINRENHALRTVITKINRVSKRVFVSAIVLIITNVLIDALLWIFAHHPLIQLFVVIVQWLFSAAQYLLVIFIYKDWKIRLCPLCSYGYIKCCTCDAHIHATEMITNSNQLCVELTSTVGSSSIADVPGLIRDVSKERVESREATFS
eukprot:98638_1